MPRTARAPVGGYCYHVINRGNARSEVFHYEAAYHAFVRLMGRACGRRAMRVPAYCLIPKHFHLALWPKGDNDLRPWMQWLLTAHVHGYRKQYQSTGHVWQGRFKAFPVAEDEHLLTVLRYIERNPVRAGLVTRAEDWPFSSLRQFTHPERLPFLDPGPVGPGTDWVSHVDLPLSDKDLRRLRYSVNRGAPFGGEEWVVQPDARLGLQSTLRPSGRPPKQTTGPGNLESSLLL